MRISKKKNALQHLLQYEKICKQSGRKLQDYYYDIIKLLKGEPINIDSQHARIAYAFVSHPERALHTIATPDCFDCEHCELKEGCRYPLLSQLEDVIQKAMAEKIIDQNTLKEIF